MTSGKNCFSLIGGVAAFLLVLTPNAFAKHSGTGGQATVDCGDEVITYSPISLWPPNHKLATINISLAESELVTDSDTLGLQVTGISSTQDAEDAAGGAGCGPANNPDWSFNPALVSGPTGNDTVTVSDPVQVRAERCAQDKTARVYTIDVTCTDEGGTDSVTLTVTVPHDKGHHRP